MSLIFFSVFIFNLFLSLLFYGSYCFLFYDSCYFLFYDSCYFSFYFLIVLLKIFFLLIFLRLLYFFCSTSYFIYFFLSFLEFISSTCLVHFFIINFIRARILINSRTKLIKKAVLATAIKIIKDTYSGSQACIGDYGNISLTVKYKSK